MNFLIFILGIEAKKCKELAQGHVADLSVFKVHDLSIAQGCLQVERIPRIIRHLGRHLQGGFI